MELVDDDGGGEGEGSNGSGGAGLWRLPVPEDGAEAQGRWDSDFFFSSPPLPLSSASTSLPKIFHGCSNAAGGGVMGVMFC